MSRIVIGVISDTHGPIPPAAAEALQGSHHIICAGDLMDDDVVASLRRIAPNVTVVRGNMDWEEPNRSLPATSVARIDGIDILAIHDLNRLDLDPEDAGFAAVIHGHTHRASIEWEGKLLYFNPGTAGEPRRGRPATVGRIVLEDGVLTPEIIVIDEDTI